MTTANANRFLLLLCCFNDVDDADDDDGDTPRVSFAPFIHILPTAEHIVYIQRNAQQTNERASECHYFRASFIITS